MSPHLLAALDDVLARDGDVDDALRAALDLLVAEPGIEWAGIRFFEEGELVLGPSTGSAAETHRVATPIVYRADAVGELVVDGLAEQSLLSEFARRISAYVLLGWDTGGEAWEP